MLSNNRLQKKVYTFLRSNRELAHLAVDIRKQVSACWLSMMYGVELQWGVPLSCMGSCLACILNTHLKTKCMISFGVSSGHTG